MVNALFVYGCCSMRVKKDINIVCKENVDIFKVKTGVTQNYQYASKA
jgi:hypothetical protein